MKYFAQLTLLTALILSSCGGGGGGGGGGAPAPTGGAGPDIGALTGLDPVEANQSIVSNVMASLNEGEVITAKGRTATQCGGIQYSYTLARQGSSAKIGIKTFFDFRSGMNLDEKTEMINKVNSCIQPLKDFYAKNNIIMDWTYSSAELGGQFSKQDADATVTLDSADGRAKSIYWYADSFGEECKVIIHEMGHLLGLPDEYSEAGTCRTAAFEAHEPSMMANHRENGAEFQPRHVLAILDQALSSKITISTQGNFDVANEVANLSAELNAYGCSLVSPQNLTSYLQTKGSVEYRESDISSYIVTKIEMAEGQINNFFADWEYWETSKWIKATHVRCSISQFGKAFFAGEQFPLVYEALGSSALKMNYSSFDLTPYHKQFPPLVYERISNLADEKVVESDLVQRNYY